MREKEEVVNWDIIIIVPKSCFHYNWFKWPTQGSELNP